MWYKVILILLCAKLNATFCEKTVGNFIGSFLTFYVKSIDLLCRLRYNVTIGDGYMKKTERLNDLLKMIDNLSASEIEIIAGELYNKLSDCKSDEDTSAYNFTPEEVMACKHCGSLDFVKNGRDRHGHTRYICKDCHKTFSKNTNTVVAGTHKDSAVWKKYIQFMLEGKSIAKCAELCGLSIQTSFDWRHKILNALTESSFSGSLNGLVEMDEMFVRISYKGNHKNSKSFVMPRKAYHRGSDNRAKDNASKACLLCGVERNKAFFGEVTCRGLINVPMLTKVLDNRLAKDCVVMTDGSYAFGRYFKDRGDIEHISLPGHKNGNIPEVMGAFHINNVNALHKRFRDFLDKYNGVSTKYLGNYLALFLWLENNKQCDRTYRICQALAKDGTNVTAATLHCLAPAPDFAPAA